MQRIVDFILEIDKLKGVSRKVRPVGMDRFENPAEHSWQIALLAISLSAYTEETLNLDRVIKMLLIHDLGEIDAGDTFVFAEGDIRLQHLKEQDGVSRILAHLPEKVSVPLLELWKEFEGGISAEARFAHAVDRAMPVLLNLANEGGSWKEHGISYERVVTRVGPEIQAGCGPLWEYLRDRLEEAQLKGWFSSNDRRSE